MLFDRWTMKDLELFGFVFSLLMVVPVISAEERKPAVSQQALQPLLRTFMDELVTIEPGKPPFPKSFLMGSAQGPATERPVHRVTFDHSFRMSKYEVPQNLYEAVMGVNPSRWKGPRNSAEMMTWHEANDFCHRLTEHLHRAQLLDQGDIIRLPSEAEWEYCCRAGTTTSYSFGDSALAPGDTGKQATRLDAYSWHTGNAAGNDPPVGALKPNPWGLYDMHGYLWEYTSDTWHDNYQNAPVNGSAWIDNKGPSSGSASPHRVIRGGSWRDRYPDHRSSARKPFPSEDKSDAVGFRCLCTKAQKNPPSP